MNQAVAFTPLYGQLRPSLLSHSRRLRLSALRLLSSQAGQVDNGTAEVLKRALSGEEVSLDVQGVRERVLKISRMSQILKDDDTVGADVAARWLIGEHFLVR